jgi:insertion element IS1 protein InsB
MENDIGPVMVVKVDEAEMDEMWSFVRSKKQRRWLWSAIDHRTGKMLADVLAPHEDVALVKLKALLQPFGLIHFYTDGWGAYLRLLDSQHHTVGKANTQKSSPSI